jgi:hypothetical protein
MFKLHALDLLFGNGEWIGKEDGEWIGKVRVKLQV